MRVGTPAVRAFRRWLGETGHKHSSVGDNPGDERCRLFFSPFRLPLRIGSWVRYGCSSASLHGHRQCDRFMARRWPATDSELASKNQTKGVRAKHATPSQLNPVHVGRRWRYPRPTQKQRNREHSSSFGSWLRCSTYMVSCIIPKESTHVGEWAADLPPPPPVCVCRRTAASGKVIGAVPCYWPRIC